MSLLASSHFARDLARLLAGWLAVIVFVQAMAAALGMVQGPRHVHANAAAAFVHADAAHEAAHHEHGGWARHVHAEPAHDPMLGDEAQDLGAVAGLVLSAMVALDTVRDGVRSVDVGHVMCASPAWSCLTHTAPFPERPPRA